MDEKSLVYGETIMIMKITDQADTSLVDGSIAYDSTTKVLTFTPTSNWTASDKHQIVITKRVRDVAGNYLASVFVGHFTVTA